MKRYRQPRGLLRVIALIAVSASPEGWMPAVSRGRRRDLRSGTFVIVDRAGHQTILGRVPGNIWGPRVSPDGRQLTFTLTGNARRRQHVRRSADESFRCASHWFRPQSVLVATTRYAPVLLRRRNGRSCCGAASKATPASSSRRRRARPSRAARTAASSRMSCRWTIVSPAGRSISPPHVHENPRQRPRDARHQHLHGRPLDRISIDEVRAPRGVRAAAGTSRADGAGKQGRRFPAAVVGGHAGDVLR